MRYSQHKVLLTVSPLLPSSLQQPGVCSRNQLLLPSSAPRSVNISILLRRLRILPVATSVYYPLQRRQRSGIQAFGSANSFAYKQLPPLSPLFALFSALPSFVFNGLQPLLRKHPGWGWVPRPAEAPPFACHSPQLLSEGYAWSLARRASPAASVDSFLQKVKRTWFAPSRASL